MYEINHITWHNYYKGLSGYKVICFYTPERTEDEVYIALIKLLEDRHRGLMGFLSVDISQNLLLCKEMNITTSPETIIQSMNFQLSIKGFNHIVIGRKINSLAKNILNSCLRGPQKKRRRWR